MAIYHLHIKTLTRSKGQSAIAKAAYNSCSSLSTASGETLDYSKKSGLFLAEMIAAPGADPAERGDFWRMMEAQEKRKDSQIAREIEISLPIELTPDQNRVLAQDMAKAIRERYDFQAVDLCIHYPVKRRKRATSKEQPHIHLLTPTRDSQGKKIKSFQKDEYEGTLREVRLLWEEKANAALAQAGIEARISANSLENQLQELEAREAEIKRQLEETRHAELFEEERIRTAARTATEAADRARKADEASQEKADRSAPTGKPATDRAGETGRQNQCQAEPNARPNQPAGRENNQRNGSDRNETLERDRSDTRPDTAVARSERYTGKSTVTERNHRETRQTGDQDRPNRRAAIRTKAALIIWRIKTLNQNAGDDHGKHHRNNRPDTDYTYTGPRM